MPIYALISDQCRKDAKKQQYGSILEAFKQKVESTQSIEVFDRFPPPFLKKRFERQIRLVAKELYTGDHNVIVFLRLLVRGGNEYATFGGNEYRELPGFDPDSSEFSEKSLLQYVESRKDPLPPPPPPPSQTEGEYLHTALALSQNAYRDSHCCETKLWVESIAEVQFLDRLNLFVEPVFDTLNSTETGLAEIRCANDNQYGILFRRIPNHNMVILFTPFKGDAPRNKVEKLYPELLDINSFDKELVIKRAKRAYPYDLLLNEDAWFQVQKDRDGSMALSEEEIEVLESARSFDGGYPLFINGRAGSGKSTILQYLFSEYLYYYLKNQKSTPSPIYFACNDELLASCSGRVHSLVSTLDKQADQVHIKDSLGGHWDLVSRNAFRNFHSWLHSLVPEDQFPPEKLIEYGGFKNWWDGKFSRDRSAKQLYDADLSWHVIRTYIKGISSEGFLDPDDYLEIPSKQKSVTSETYKIVFEKVWNRYVEDQKEIGLWDHQDLARFALDNDLIKADHPVIYCDESQDFTRIELEILYRLCLFNNRTLDSHDLLKIPIAFAGDPFQTLNPTGFRWEGTKAFFTEKFIKAYPDQKRRDINYQELSYNYRSSGHIVRFCNSLQLVRSIAFDFSDINPQHPWDDDDDSPNVYYFERGDLEVLNTLKNQSEIRIIVPCEEGGEGEWAQNNGLAEFVDFDEANVPKNVVSPSRVKGLEFSRVVLFGFGGACPYSLKSVLDGLSEPLLGDQAIEPQYYLNRLYVAASRPRRRLFIIDTVEDLESFWNKIFTNQDELMLLAKNVDRWDGSCGQLIRGSIDSWKGDGEDAYEIAEKLAKEGRLRKDRVLLRQAAQSYGSTGKNKIQARECRAEALELEGSFLEAAEIWLTNENYKRSMSAAWQSKEEGFDFILELGQQRPDLKKDNEYKIVAYLKSEPDMGGGVTLLKVLVDSLSDESRKEDILIKATWQVAILACLDRMLGTDESGTGLWDVSYKSIHTLFKSGVKIPQLTLGEFAYRADKLEVAFNHWNETSSDERQKIHKRFLRSKGASLDFPLNLEAYGELLSNAQSKDDAEKILSLVHQEGTDQLSASQFEIVIRAKIRLGEFENLSDDLDQLVDEYLLAEIIFEFVRENHIDNFKVSFSRFLELLANKDGWEAIIEIFRGHQPKLKNSEGRELLFPRDFKTFRSNHPKIVEQEIVKYIAYDQHIEHARNNQKTEIANLIRENFPGNFSWKEKIHPIVVGRALEKAGLFRETLPYYEEVMGHDLLSEDCAMLARQRWARTKALQAIRDKETGSESRAKKNANEAFEMAKKAGFKSIEDIPNQIPDIGELPSIIADPTGTQEKSDEKKPPTQKKKSKSTPKTRKQRQKKQAEETNNFSRTIEFENCRIRVSLDGIRVNFEHIETFEQASLQLSNRSATFEALNIPVDSENIIRFKKWDFVVSLARLDSGRLDIETSDGVAVTLPVAPVKIDP